MGKEGALNYRALADFRHEIRRFLNFSEQAARAADTEPQQHQALLALKGLPESWRANVGTLAQRLQIQHHSAVELTDRLQRRGLIRRRRSRADRREVLLQLTCKGEKILSQLSISHQAELRTAAPALVRLLRHVIRRPAGTPSNTMRATRSGIIEKQGLSRQNRANRHKNRPADNPTLRGGMGHDPMRR